MEQTPILYLNEFSESTFMYFQKTFPLLNISKFNIITVGNQGFDVFIAYSYDGKNYSEFKTIESYPDTIIDGDNELYVCVWFKRIIRNDLDKAHTLYEKKNVEATPQRIILQSVSYGIEEFSNDDFKYQELFNLIDEFPRWNFYDNQAVTIQRWLSTCNSMAEMYGHTCIYFKTEPVELTDKNPQSGIHGTNHTFQNNVIRNVTSIKKLHILCPNNELPQDRNVFTEWDMPLQDDFLIHIVKQKFEQAFGLKTIPNEKDYIYFPIINKIFRVSTIQPKNGLMGVIGWYEVFLAKYEEDDCVRVDNNLRNTMGGIPGVTEGLENFGDLEGQDDLWDEFNELSEDTVISEEKINQSTVEEKKVVTDNFTNKLEDTTFYVTLKETEKLRELYDKRLNIVSVNPDDSLFPITMYDCSSINKRVVGLQYSLKDYSVTNKFSTLAKTNWLLTFNFVLTGRHQTEVFDLISQDTMVVVSILCKNKQLVLFDTSAQQEIIVEHPFIDNELYQVCIDYNIMRKQFSIKIFKLKDKQKTLDYQNIYIVDNHLLQIPISHLQLFGGNFLTNDIQLSIDKKKLLDDKCLPLMNMYKF